jgi:hypothetical protein
MRTSLLFLLVTSTLFLSITVRAEIPQVISYQGKVTDSGGTTVPDGSYDMAFRIYDAATGGTSEWDSGTLSVDVSGGVFSVLLGDGNPIILDFDDDYWLEVEIQSDVQSPRQSLGSVGYAYMASGLVPGTLVEGSVTSGTSAAIKGVNTASSGTRYGGYFESASTTGRAVAATATATTGINYGGKFHSSSTSGRGCYGWATATTGTTYGGAFKSSSPDGYGVWGKAEANSGINYGVYGESASTAGAGVYGRATAITGSTWGVQGRSASTHGVGVEGRATADSGYTWGVYGWSESTNGRGVHGLTSAATGETYGVHGESESTSGRGVYGEATATSGETYGGAFKSSSPDGCGVWGKAEATTGGCNGGFFETASSLGTGVSGVATSTTGETSGVFGGNYSTTDGSRGVFGWCGSTAGATYGVYGRTDSPSADACGVYGEVTVTSGGETYAVRGVTSAWNGTAIKGEGGYTGVSGSGAYQGGYFRDTDDNLFSRVAYSTYKISGSGTCAFVQNHPYERDRVIVYAAPEGDEVATYTRGTARLVDGEARVRLGETFGWVTNPDIGLTAHLTPRGCGSVLYVESLTTEEMTVRSFEGFPSDVVFDYIVYGLRIGFEDISIVQEKQEENCIPSMASHRNRFAQYPDLRKYSPLQRFKRMHANATKDDVLDLTASDALRAAIQD